MNKWARQHGGLILHILVAVFTFFGLAIVCDEYFVASLDRLCEGELESRDFYIHLEEVLNSVP